MECIPPDVQVHLVNCYNQYWRDPPLQVIKELIKHKKFLDAFVHSLLYIQFKLTGGRYWFYKWLLRNEPMMEGHFDVAIAYAGPSQAIDYYVCKKIKADVKVGWIHFDVTQFGIDQGMTERLYQTYKKIFIVSQKAKERFDSLFPNLKDKTEVFYNIVNPEQIRQLADKGETFSDSFTGKRILTVGRLSKEKGQDIAIYALKILMEQNVNVKWYFVGDGKLRSEVGRIAQEMAITDRVAFLGTHANPYAFMRDCDIYVQPSRHEGFCIALAEALCFPNPIVATNFAGADEQLRERKNGYICGMTAENMAERIKSVAKTTFV